MQLQAGNHPYHRFAALSREPGHCQKKPHRVQLTVKAPLACLQPQLSSLRICRWAQQGSAAHPTAAGITC